MRIYRGFIAITLYPTLRLFCLTLALLGPASAQAWDARLRLDYFPTLLYDDDPAHIHLSVIPGIEPGHSIRFEALSDADIPEWVEEPEPDAQGILRLTLRPRERRGIALCRILLLQEGKIQDTFQFRLVQPAKGLPPLNAAGDGLWDSKNIRCMLLAQHRVRQVDRSWLPVKILRGLWKKDKKPAGLQVLSDLDLPVKEYERVRFWLAQTGDEPSRPIHDAIATISRVRESPPMESTCLFVGSRDVQAGTDPRDFRMGLEVILQHLQSLGAADFRLAQPIAPPHYQERLGAYRERVLEVAHVYFIHRTFEVDSSLTHDFWNAQPGSSITVRFPSIQALRPVAAALVTEGLKPR